MGMSTKPRASRSFARIIILLSAAGVLLANAARAEVVNFDNTSPGALPSGWLSGVTGKGTPKWSVEADSTALSPPNVLKQSGEGTYPWCVKTNESLTDGFLEVKFKPVSGREDQAGGLIWRWQDGGNYYIARANALEDNVMVFHTVQGIRKAFGDVKVKVAPNQWHTLRVEFAGTRFRVFFDGKKVLQARDESFKQAGAVGVWTKADSVTLFDDFNFGAK
jgi:hypothetical protein